MSFITKKNKTDDGFTYIELMITIIITALLIVGVSQGLLTGSRVLEKATVNSVTTGSILQMDNLIRKNVARIYFPFWSGGINIAEDTSTIEIPFFEGNENAFLTFSFENNYLNIAIKKPDEDFLTNSSGDGYLSETIQTFGKFSSVDFKPALTPGEAVFGVEFIVHPIEKKYPPVTIIARFGSLPLTLSGENNKSSD